MKRREGRSTGGAGARKLTLSLSTSLDNFIAREDGACDWLLYGREAAEVSKAYWKTVDTVLLGRRTYELGGASYPRVHCYVFSRTLRRAPGAKLVRGDAAKFVAQLKREPGKGICLFGGGELARSLLAAGLVDEMLLNVHPILLGRGIPLFDGLRRDVGLELLDHRICGKGNAILSYRVQRI